MDQTWLILAIAIVTVGVVVQSLLKGPKPKRIYDSQTAKRREVIQRLAGEQVGAIDWEHLTDVLNRAGFKNRKGRKFTAIMIKKEHADMLTKGIKPSQKDRL